MAINEELEEITIKAMSRTFNEVDANFRLLSDNEEGLGAAIIKGMGELMVDEPHKVRFHFSAAIGYGYDFGKKDPSGVSAKEVYERAVRNTKKNPFGDMGEKFLASGVEEERFGWYVTSVGR